MNYIKVNLNKRTMIIFNFYYKVWVDCIIKARSIPSNKSNWKGFTLTFMTMAMSINFACIISIIQRSILHMNFYYFEIDIFPGSSIDAFISGFILFILPNLFLNYFLIFKNNRYELLLAKYKSYDGKLFISYFVISLVLPFVLIITAKWIF